MLVLSRKLSQQILIGSDIAITVVRVEGNHVRLGIEAPAGVSILRDELVTRQNPNDARPTAVVGRLGVRTV
jgi:carbon storage regulator